LCESASPNFSQVTFWLCNFLAQKYWRKRQGVKGIFSACKPKFQSTNRLKFLFYLQNAEHVDHVQRQINGFATVLGRIL